MIVDTSVIVAILREEAGADLLRELLLDAPKIGVPASCYLEACMVLSGTRGPDARVAVDALLAVFDAQIIPFTPIHARAAADAFLRFGKGRHPAGLNFSDCMSYAVAKVEGLPLLNVGADFGMTDVAVVFA